MKELNMNCINDGLKKVSFSFGKEFEVTNEHCINWDGPICYTNYNFKIGDYTYPIRVEVPLIKVGTKFEPTLPKNIGDLISSYLLNDEEFPKELIQSFDEKIGTNYNKLIEECPKDDPLWWKSVYWQYIWVQLLNNLDVLFNKIREKVNN